MLPVVKRYIRKEHLHLYFLGSILLIGIFLRFYNIPERYSLDGDATRDALVALEGARQWQLPLTGPFSSVGAFTFGPWYYYEIILFSILLPIHFAPWMFISLTSVLFIFIMYKIGEKIEGKSLGLIVALFVAVSPTLIGVGTGLSNPNLISFYAGLSFFIFLKLLKEEVTPLWSFLFGICLGLGLNHHYQSMGLLILPVLLVLAKPKTYLSSLIIGTGIFITFIPLLFFDLTNHWFTMRNMYYYYTVGKDVIYVPNRWLFYLRDFWPSFISSTWGVSIPIAILIGVAFVSTVINRLYKKNLSISYVMLFITFFCNFVLLRYYWGERGYQYLQFLYPLLYLFFALPLWRLYESRYRFVSYLFIAVFVVLILPQSIQLLTNHQRSDQMRIETKQILSYANNRNIHLYTCANHDNDRILALTYLLSHSSNPTGEHVRIGLINDKCSFPENERFIKNKSLDILYSHSQQLELLYPHFGERFIDFTAASESAILTSGYKQVSSKTVSEGVTRWYFIEQP